MKSCDRMASLGAAVVTLAAWLVVWTGTGAALEQRALASAASTATVGLADHASPAPVARVSRQQLTDRPSSDDVRCLALNIYWEARSEPLLGQMAVAAVTLNRVANLAFPATVCDVVREGSKSGRSSGCQFSWWCDGKMDAPEEQPSWRAARALAYLALQFDLPDPTGGALWYHADYVQPPWTREKARIMKIGSHLFYREPGAPSHPEVAVPLPPLP